MTPARPLAFAAALILAATAGATRAQAMDSMAMSDSPGAVSMPIVSSAAQEGRSGMESPRARPMPKKARGRKMRRSMPSGAMVSAPRARPMRQEPVGMMPPPPPPPPRRDMAPAPGAMAMPPPPPAPMPRR